VFVDAQVLRAEDRGGAVFLERSAVAASCVRSSPYAAGPHTAGVTVTWVGVHALGVTFQRQLHQEVAHLLEVLAADALRSTQKVLLTLGGTRTTPLPIRESKAKAARTRFAPIDPISRASRIVVARRARRGRVASVRASSGQRSQYEVGCLRPVTGAGDASTEVQG